MKLKLIQTDESYRLFAKDDKTWKANLHLENSVPICTFFKEKLLIIDLLKNRDSNLHRVWGAKIPQSNLNWVFWKKIPRAFSWPNYFYPKNFSTFMNKSSRVNSIWTKDPCLVFLYDRKRPIQWRSFSKLKSWRPQTFLDYQQLKLNFEHYL
jgi:hypothetical protein